MHDFFQPAWDDPGEYTDLDPIPDLAPMGPMVTQTGAPGGAARFGAVATLPSGSSVLGELGRQAAVDVLKDPYVQQQIDQVQIECKEQAKVGVAEFMQENWHWFTVAGLALIAGNFLMLTLGVVPLVRPRRG